MIPSEVLRKVKQIEIRTRKAVNSAVSGAYTSAFKGKGMEFSEVREYIPGDDIRSIDWNVTAKMGHPYTKKFIEERELTVLLVVDASSSGDFGTRFEMKGEIMALISALLAFSAIKNNDRVGLCIFTSEVELFIPPQKGRKHVLRVIRELLYFKPKNKGTDLGQTLDYLQRILNRRSVVFILSDFETGQFQTPLKLMARKHDVVALSIQDPREKDLPSMGFLELEDAETGETILIDTASSSFRGAFSQKSTQSALALKSFFQKLHVDFVEVVIKDSFDATLHPVIQFFQKRASSLPGK